MAEIICLSRLELLALCGAIWLGTASIAWQYHLGKLAEIKKQKT